MLGVGFAAVGLLITLWSWFDWDFGGRPSDSNPGATVPTTAGGTFAPSPVPTSSRPASASAAAPPVQRIEIVVVPGTPNQANVNQASSDEVAPDWASRLAGILTSLGTLLVGVASVAALRRARSAEQAASAASVAATEAAAVQRESDRLRPSRPS